MNEEQDPSLPRRYNRRKAMQILALGTAGAGIAMTKHNGMASFLMSDTDNSPVAADQTRRVLETVYRDAWVWTPGFMKALTFVSGQRPILPQDRQFGVPVMEVTVTGKASHQAPIVARLPSYEQDSEVAKILQSRPADTRGAVGFGIGHAGGIWMVFSPQAAELIEEARHVVSTPNGEETRFYTGSDFADRLGSNLVLENHADRLDIMMKSGTEIQYGFTQVPDSPVEP